MCFLKEQVIVMKYCVLGFVRWQCTCVFVIHKYVLLLFCGYIQPVWCYFSSIFSFYTVNDGTKIWASLWYWKILTELSLVSPLNLSFVFVLFWKLWFSHAWKDGGNVCEVWTHAFPFVHICSHVSCALHFSKENSVSFWICCRFPFGYVSVVVFWNNMRRSTFSLCKIFNPICAFYFPRW